MKKSARDGVDIDYLFLQVFVDQAIVSDAQNCGNILARIGPFAIERGLVAAQQDETRVAIATVQTPGGIVRYDGDARIDGVPGSAAPMRRSACWARSASRRPA
ncbi:2-methylaconitate cis-trans-isomerase PrpF [Sphingobium xenophagum]|uniref:2-methylaconitate cis-trans-isomerase PrpF n=1 Tax=Sphingobium xenophagum TaxID=121428 RepID=A0ABU1X577_SPHXE|nr:2-methylaconitate cis-trans-isomerase PrpF [Sphingobium xenophagum]